MYRDTEPRWREARPRRGSMDRGGASRERSASLLDPSFGADGRGREIGPPPSTRGWDKINDGLGRTRSARDGPRSIPQSPTRGRYPEGYGDPNQPPPRNTSSDRRTTIHNDRPVDLRYDQYEHDDRREPRRERRASLSRESRPERRGSVSRAGDRSVERRGFGIRLENGDRDRYGRGSDESFNERKYRDSGFVEPHRRDIAPDVSFHEDKRVEQEKKDRSLPNDERDRQRDRDTRDRDSKKRDDDRGYPERDYDRERERPRDRERDYEKDTDSDRDRERHNNRRDADRDYNRKDKESRDSGDSGSQSISKTATGGLAGAAAALGLGKFLNKDKSNSESRDKDRERDRDRYDEPRSDRRSRPPESYSDEKAPSYDRDADRDRYRDRDADRGLGFAFESAPSKTPTPAAPHNRDREVEREHEDKNVKMPSIPPAPDTVDADEDYRRRMEQVQRELGQPAQPPTQQNSESDPDRERRRREREQRMREREGRPAVDLAIPGGTASAPNLNAPAPQLRRSFEDESDISSLPPGLKRRPSILDQPMNIHEGQGIPGAQIIDNSLSEKRENRVRIVDPPAAADDDEGKRPRGILKRPTEKFPEDKHVIREGVAPLKDATKKGIPPGARWTKIDRRLVNPEALDEAKERFEERLDCVIVLRVLTKEEIQTLADRTRELRDERYEEERAERKEARRRERKSTRRDDDEYSEEDSEFEFSSGHRPAPKMLEAPASATGSNSMPGSWTGGSAAPAAPPSTASGTGSWAPSSTSDRDRRRDRDYDRDRDGDRDGQYNMSGGLGR